MFEGEKRGRPAAAGVMVLALVVGACSGSESKKPAA